MIALHEKLNVLINNYWCIIIVYLFIQTKKASLNIWKLCKCVQFQTLDKFLGGLFLYHRFMTSWKWFVALTLHVIQISAGQHLSLGLICRNFLVDGRLYGGHAADADAFSQVVAGPLGSSRPVDGLPAKPASCRHTGGFWRRVKPVKTTATSKRAMPECLVGSD